MTAWAGSESMTETSCRPVVLSPTDFAQEIMREILRQNADILRNLLNPMIYMPPENAAPDLSKLSVKDTGEIRHGKG